MSKLTSGIIKSASLNYAGFVHSRRLDKRASLKRVIKHYKATDYKMIITTGGLIKIRNSTKHKTSAAPFSVPSSSETGYSNKISK